MSEVNTKKHTVEKTYTRSLLYQMEMTTRYFKFLANQLFKKLEIQISPVNFATLDILSQNPDLCQRDLAKILLKDRANTGKIVDHLEEAGFVERYITTRGKRLVKMIKITENGRKCVKDINDKISYFVKTVDSKFLIEEQAYVIKSLTNIREFLKENIEINI